MPACSVLFDNNCKPLYEFGKHHRNKVIWSPSSRLVALGGFGNLNGEIEIWNAIIKKKIGLFKS